MKAEGNEMGSKGARCHSTRFQLNWSNHGIGNLNGFKVKYLVYYEIQIAIDKNNNYNVMKGRHPVATTCWKLYEDYGNSLSNLV
jgi:hypothetical protein